MIAFKFGNLILFDRIMKEIKDKTGMNSFLGRELVKAVQGNHLEIIRETFNYFPKVKIDPESLAYAAALGHAEILRFLLSAGGDPDVRLSGGQLCQFAKDEAIRDIIVEYGGSRERRDAILIDGRLEYADKAT
jgi:hypothetical protein